MILWLCLCKSNFPWCSFEIDLPAAIQNKQLLVVFGWLFLNMPSTSGFKKPFVEHFLLFLVGITIFKITLLNFAKFSQPNIFYLVIAQVTRANSFSYLRGCLHVEINTGIELIRGWNYPCLWWSVSYCLHVSPTWNIIRDELISVKNSGMKFHPGIKNK